MKKVFKRDRLIDINTILSLSIITLFIITVVLYLTYGFPKLIDGFSLFLYALLSLQLLMFLRFEKKSRNQLLLLYSFVLVYFYFTRFITIYLNGVSKTTGVLNRIIPTESYHIQIILFYIFCANFFFFLVFFCPKHYLKRKSSRVYWSLKIIWLYFY